MHRRMRSNRGAVARPRGIITARTAIIRHNKRHQGAIKTRLYLHRLPLRLVILNEGRVLLLSAAEKALLDQLACGDLKAAEHPLAQLHGGWLIGIFCFCKQGKPDLQRSLAQYLQQQFDKILV